MMPHVVRRFLYQLATHIVFLWFAKGENNTNDILTSSMIDVLSTHYETTPYNDQETLDFTSSSVESSQVQTTLWPSYSLSEFSSVMTDVSYFPLDFSSRELLSSTVPLLNNGISEVVTSMDISNYVDERSPLIHSSTATSFSYKPSFSIKIFGSMADESHGYITSNNPTITSYLPLLKPKATRALIEISPYPHFHTPLMSLLVATSSLPFQPEESLQTTSVVYSSMPSVTFPISDNESTTTELSSVPEDSDHKKLLMLVLRAEDCSKLSKADFEKMLGKLMAKFGFGDVVPQVSNAQCHSHLHINLTLGSAAPTLRFLPNMDSKNNVTVDVLNRTFRIVKVEKVDLRFEKSQSFNASSSIITKVAKHESVAYIAVGVSFGLVLVICVSVCCVKCCCLRKSKKRYISGAKCTHMRLRPDDYTLTPIPRPTSLYVDYYRGSAAADIYSTTSAGSIASTTPTVEQGVIQPFDTSIIPLEDSAALSMDISRDPSIESVPVQSDMKTFHIHGFAAKGLHNGAAADSKEQLNPKQNSRKPDTKASGVANPTFQRY